MFVSFDVQGLEQPLVHVAHEPYSKCFKSSKYFVLFISKYVKVKDQVVLLVMSHSYLSALCFAKL